MSSEDRLSAIADRIADGSAIDWPADASATDPDERATLEALKVIAALATLHRRPLEVSPNATASEGTPWGSLTITSQIGAGRFGQVYLAWDARLQRRVALKLLLAESPAASASPAHAIEEARLLARVRHSNVLSVHGAECIDNQVGIWTEFIEGRTLEDLLNERGPMSPADVVSIGLDLCRALGAVHDAGLLHRDVKLQNVMRETGGRIVLMDFGTGHDLQARPTRAGDLSGTPLYLAPEILAGGEATQAGDVYALAVLLFRLLTGEYPVPGRTLEDVRAGHRQGSAARLRDARPDLPAALIDAIDRGLASDPARRHLKASAFARALAHRPRHRFVAKLALGIAAGVFVVVGAWPREAVAPPVSAVAPPVSVVAPPVAEAPRSQVQPSSDSSVRRQDAGTLDIAGVRSRFQPDNTVRKIRLPQSVMGHASRDGRYLPYVDEAGDLRVWQRSTGSSVRVVGPSTPDEVILATLMSPSGDRVAYGFQTADGGRELRSVNVDGTAPIILSARQTAYNPVPIEWSRDGRDILCQLNQKDRSADLVLIPATGGTPKVILTFRSDQARPEHPSLSPDGGFVVYARRADLKHRDLAIVATDGTQPPRSLLNGAADDSSPAWTPDGRAVFFLRESAAYPGESQDGWVLPVSSGVPIGEPHLVVSNLGPVYGLTIADTGALFFAHPTRVVDVYTRVADLSGAGEHGPQTRIDPASIGEHIAPSWSPDGESIAYLTTRESPGGGNPLKTLTIKDMRTGRARELSPNIPRVGGYTPQWARNGQSVTVFGWTLKPQVFQYFRVDVRTGDTSTVFTPDMRPLGDGFFEYSPDERTFFYINAQGIVARDLASGSEDIVVAMGARTGIGRFGFSPDRNSIAFISTRGANPKAAIALEVQSAGESPRQLVSTVSPEQLQFQGWIPKTEDVLYSTGDPKAPMKLWRVSTLGGEPRDMRFENAGNVTNPMSLNRDGRRLAYVERDVYSELWVRERLLPISSSR